MTENQDYKLCPYCSEEIKNEAIKCKHCKSSLLDIPVTEALGQAHIKNTSWQPVWMWVAVVAVIVFTIMVVYDLSSQQASQTQATATNSTQTTSPEVETEPVASITFSKIGESTTFNDWAYKLVDVEVHSALQSERARGQYVAFIFEMTNNAKIPREVGYMFQAEDDQGRVFKFDSTASLDHHQAFRTDSWHHDDIGPSFTATMAIVFDVPLDAKTVFVYPTDLREEDYTITAFFMHDIVN